MVCEGRVVLSSHVLRILWAYCILFRRKNGITRNHRASCTLGNGCLLFYTVTTGRVLHEEHIELLMEEFEFLKREVAGKELLKGSLRFTGQCKAGLLAKGEGVGKGPGTNIDGSRNHPD